MKISRVLLILAASSATGCGDNANRETKPLTLPSVTDTMREIEFKQLHARLNQLEEETRNLRYERTAYLTPTNDGFSVIVTDIGPLTLKIKGVTAFADGSRIRLQIGNPTTADLSGLTTKMRWGPVNAGGLLDLEKATPERTVKIDGAVRAGQWTELNVDLGQVPPPKMGMIEVSNIDVKTISLKQ